MPILSSINAKQFAFYLTFFVLASCGGGGGSDGDGGNETDTTPDIFNFIDQTDIELNTLISSNSITVTGINDAANIGIINGEYAIDGGSFTSSAGTVNNDQTVTVRQTSAINFLTSTDSTLTIGGVSDTFTTTTLAQDITPDAFSFIDQTDVALNAFISSNSISVTGINDAVAISISNGEYSIDGGSYTSTAGTVNNNQSITVRQMSSAGFLAQTDTTLTIGGVSDTFSVTTPAQGNIPDAFSFIDQTNVAINTVVSSNSITVTGIDNTTSISISTGEYSIDGGSYTSTSGTISNNQSVTVRQTSSSDFLTSTNTTLTIGGVSDTFTTTTLAQDTTPNAFSFIDQTNIAINTVISSNSVTITGITGAVTISIINGEYAIDGGSFTSVAGTITNNQSVTVRQTASASFSSNSDSILTIGGVSDTFTVTTLVQDTSPDAFSFSDQTDVALNSLVTSNSISVTGINDAVTISIANGEYSIDGGSFTSAAGTINNGQSVVVRHTASADFASSTDSVLTIGDVNDSFTSTTLAQNNTPNAFSFIDQTNVAINTAVSSNSVTITGITGAVAISIANGEYAIDGGSFTSVAGTINSGQSVVVRQTTSADFATSTDSTLTIGNVSDTFTLTTLIQDLTVNNFYFNDQLDVSLSTLITSESITVSGINDAVAISITNGEYAIDGGSFTSTAGTINNGQSVVVRHTTSADFATSTHSSLTVGNVSDTFTTITIAQNNTPDAFSFTDQSDVALNSLVTSNSITVSGINDSVAISISNGEYAIDGGSFTNLAGTINNGQSVVVRQTASADFASSTDSTLTIGSVSDTFTITTLAQDITPDAFSFTEQTGVALSTVVTSNSAAISGITGAVTISITHGEYAIDGGGFTSAVGTISNNQNVVLRQTSSASFSSNMDSVLTIGDVSNTFTVTTLVQDTTPDAFSFTDQTDVALSTVIASNTLSIMGINDNVAISISNGEYAIDDGSFTSAAGTISNGQNVTVRQTSSADFATSTDSTLTIGNVSDTFSVTTLAQSSTPNAFSFTDQNNIALSAVVISNSITVTGINSAVAISISNGEYSIDDGSFTSLAGTINNDQSVTVRQTASADFASSTASTLTIGGVNATFTVTTLADGDTPDSFSFINPTNVALTTLTTSNSITVTGITNAVTISITNGEYSINGGSFTSTTGSVNNNQTVTVRHTSSANFLTSTNSTLTVGSYSDVFTSTTLAQDTTPNTFSFTDQSGVALSTLITSNSITVTDINDATSISIINGQYAIDGGSFTSVAGTINNGQSVTVQQTSSASFSSNTDSILNIGGVTDTFTVTTLVQDTTPNVFSFNDQTDAPLSETITSNVITVSGINDSAAISISNGQYAIDGGSYTSATGTVNNNQSVIVRQTSSASFSDSTNSTLTIGGVSDTFTSTTLAQDTSPDAFSFSDQTNVALDTVITSNTISVTGINDNAIISITNGEYSIDGGTFSSTASTIANNQTVTVRQTSSTDFASNNNSVLTIGGISDTFTTTTLAQDITPNAFSFIDQSDVDLSTPRTSNSVTITGITGAVSISIDYGEYSIDGGAFTSSLGTINNGQSVVVRRISSHNFSTNTDSILTVGNVSDTFTVTTSVQDTTPDAFSFTNQTDVALNTAITSNTITVTGINDNAIISITNGEYSIDGGTFSSNSSTIANNQTVTVRQTSSTDFATATNSILTIGGISDTFTTTTLAQDTTPNAFSFIDQSDVDLSTARTSNSVTITGITGAVSISIDYGEYSIGNGAFTSTLGTISNNQTVRVRQTSSASFSSNTDSTLTIGDVTDTFTVTTSVQDTTPDAFSFTNQTDVALSTAITSNTITVSGINDSVAISITNGQYSINGSGFTSSSGTVNNGQTVSVRHTSSADFASNTESTLTISGLSNTFSTTTVAQDTTPNAFSFTDQNNVALSTLRTSNIAVITGITGAVPISIVNGEYAINGGSYTSSAGTISNNQSVRVRHTSSADYATATNSVLTVGSVSGDAFISTTLAQDTTPNGFSFTDQSNIALSALTTSNSVSILGITGAVPISIVNGEYSINGGSFTSSAGTISNNQSVRVRQTSSASFSTSTNSTLTIGSVSDIFTITTIAQDTTPNAFSFSDQSNVATDTVISSNAITVSDINDVANISISNGEYSIDGGSFTSVTGTVSNGQTVIVRHTSSTDFATTTNSVLTIGGVSDTFTSTTLAQDTTPNAFSFSDQSNVVINTVITSNSVTITGITGAVGISVSNGEYAIDGGDFTSATGTISNGQTVRVRHTSSSDFTTATNSALTIGSVSDIFTSTTVRQDVRPNAFYFTDQSYVMINTVITSNSVTITGITGAVDISISNGEYSINGGNFISTAGTVTNNQSVRVRHTSSSDFTTATNSVLIVGEMRDTFTSNTTTQDTTPDAFSFTDQTAVDLDSLITSNSITVTGINDAVAISVSGGEYSINGGGFTSTVGTVSNNQTVVVRHTSANTSLASRDTTLNISGVSDTFTSTTATLDTTPDAFSFTDQTDVLVNTTIISDSITVTGINSGASVSIVGGQFSIDGGSFVGSPRTIYNNQTIRVRIHSSGNYYLASTDVVLTIGGVSDTFTATTEERDAIPDAFSFIDQTNVAINTLVTSNSITVTGMNVLEFISITNGEYSIDGGSFTSDGGFISNGATVVVRQTSSGDPLTSTDTVLTIAGVVSDTFTVTTTSDVPPDAIPDTFSFIDQSDVALGAWITSNSVTISGINIATSISVSNGEYSIDGGSFTSVSGTIEDGQSVVVRHTSSASFFALTTSLLSIGGVDATFSTTSGGIGTGFNKGQGLTDEANTIAFAVDGSNDVYVGGDFVSYNGVKSSRIIRLNSDNTVDKAFNIGTGFNRTVHIIAPAIDGSNDIYVGGDFTHYNGTLSNRIIRLNSDGSIDTAFDLGTGFNQSGFSNRVINIHPLANGDLYVVGSFTTYNFNTNNFFIRHVVRLNSDGSVDNSFSYSDVGFNSSPDSSALTTHNGNEYLYVVGNFTSYDGVPYDRIIRLNSNGSIDTSFDLGTGFNSSSRVYAVSPTTDNTGDVYIGGDFDSYNGTSINNFMRLNWDGSIDSSFNVGTGFSGIIGRVYAITPAAGGDLYIGGNFETYNDVNSNRIIRLNSNGTIDTAFNVGTGFSAPGVFGASIKDIKITTDVSNDVYVAGTFKGYNATAVRNLARISPLGVLDADYIQTSGFNGEVYAINPTNDASNDIMVGGDFTGYNGSDSERIIRLNGDDGTVDSAYITGFDDTVNVIKTSLDGSNDLYIGGAFLNYNGTGYNRIIRLNSDGTVDTAFDVGTGFNGRVTSIELATDGSGDIYVGGWFSLYKGSTAERIIRLNSDGSVDTVFNISSGFNKVVHDISLTTDGSNDIYVVGEFTNYQGLGSSRIIRLNDNGSADTAFNIGLGFNGDAYSVEAFDGGVYVGGDIFIYHITPVDRLVRLNDDGSIDTGFDTSSGGFDDVVRDIALTADGKVYVGGDFDSYRNNDHYYIVRINSDGSADTTFNAGGQFDSSNFYTVRTISLANDGSNDVYLGGSFDSYDGISVDNIVRLNPNGSLN